VKLIVAVVGKPKDRHLAAAVDEYETRAARYWPLSVSEVREASARGLSADVTREREGEKLAERIPSTAMMIVCDERGTAMTSHEFSDMLTTARDQARDVGFVIGGAYGLPESLRKRASRVLQLAPWTLPHEVARLILAEQLYRAGTIARGEPYHK
jgi:23S rRNA (pseudouridine1915-N3)-methyltransferase